MGRFQVVVWCEACRGDDEGCFGGTSEVIGEAFDTREDADRAGAHYCTDLPYQYRVQQADQHAGQSGGGGLYDGQQLALAALM
jgi:hypothetical protein